MTGIACSERQSVWIARLRRWPIFAGLACLLLTACQPAADRSEAAPADPVTRWTLLADFYGGGYSNWRTLPIMQMAMHDALNAARPTYARWFPKTPDEPPANGADPEVAMAAAASEVLSRLHLDQRALTEKTLREALSHAPDGPAKEAGVRLGRAIGAAAVLRRENDGSEHNRYFGVAELPGRWRLTPTAFENSTVNSMHPFLFNAIADVPLMPPPALDSPVFRTVLADTRSVGAKFNAQRTPAQTESAKFWARQSSQRGFLRAAMNMLAKHPRPRGVFDNARILAQLVAAFADTEIVVWNAKERFSFWRPVTAIRAAGAAAGVDQQWLPVLETPPFPEYPSGHAADCFVGADYLQAVFPDVHEALAYVSMTPLGNPRLPDSPEHGMGQHAQISGYDDMEQSFSSLAAAAEDCSRSRVWAGAHFQTAEDESKRIGEYIARRAVATVPTLR